MGDSMYIVKHTLQTRDKKTKEAIYYKASSVPQKLPADIAKEAIERGFAVKVEAEKKTAKSGKTAATKKEDDVQAGDEIDFEQTSDSESEQPDSSDE
jgi:hypothetical protein